MNRWTSAVVFSVSMLVSGVTSTNGQLPLEPLNPLPLSVCTLCQTCGGLWPAFAGSWEVPLGAVEERGMECGGDLKFRDDFQPVLCCIGVPEPPGNLP